MFGSTRRPYLTTMNPADFVGSAAPVGHADRLLRGVPLLGNAVVELESKQQILVEVFRRCLASLADDAKYLLHFAEELDHPYSYSDTIRASGNSWVSTRERHDNSEIKKCYEERDKLD